MQLSTFSLGVVYTVLVLLPFTLQHLYYSMYLTHQSPSFLVILWVRDT